MKPPPPRTHFIIQARGRNSDHIPFRDSKLTLLLKDSLERDSKTLMFAMVSPVDFNAEETFSTLSFAVRVRKVELGQASKQGGSISGVAAATKAAGVLKKKAGRKKSSR